MAIQRSTTVGVFDDRTQAERAVETLHNAGIPADQIRYSHNMGTGSGLMANIKNLFSGQERSGAAIVNDLIGMGLTQEEARYYAHHYEMGHTIVAVQSSGNMPDTLGILRNCGAHDYHKQAGVGSTGVTSGVTQQSNDARTAPIRMSDTTAPSSGQGPSMGTGDTMQRPSGQNMAAQGNAPFTGDNRQTSYNQGMAAQKETSTGDTTQPSFNQTPQQTGAAYEPTRGTQPDYNRSADDTFPRNTMRADQPRPTDWRDIPPDAASQRTSDWGAQARPNMARQEVNEQPMYGDQDVNPDVRKEQDRRSVNDPDSQNRLGMPDENDPNRPGMFDRGI